jgi:hypothetical protein
MSRTKGSIVATEQAVNSGSFSSSHVITFLCQNRMAVTDPDLRRVKSDHIHFTHLSLDGAGGGIFNIPWSANRDFLVNFNEAIKRFHSGQKIKNNYQMTPPPAMAEIISNCDFIRPVFDLDLWDQGVDPHNQAQYARLRKRIAWQILCIHNVMKQIFPSNLHEHPDFSSDPGSWPMDPAFAWYKLDMVVLESQPKPLAKMVNGAMCDGIKHSFHLRFPFMRVATRMMLGIIPYLIHELEKVCPRTLDPDGSPVPGLANSWYEGLDPKIIGSGIKLPGSQKAQPCPDCYKLVQREKEEEKLAKAKRQLMSSAMIRALRPKAAPDAQEEERDEAAKTDEESRAKRAAPALPQPSVDDETTLRIHSQYVKLPTKEEILQRLDFIQTQTSTSNTTFGPSRCGHPRCANARLYDGRYHQVSTIIDATAVFNPLALVDIQAHGNQAKTAEFERDKVRMLSFLQARTQFKTSNVDFDPRINFEEYTNMYKDLAPQVSNTLSGAKRQREQGAQIVSRVHAPHADISKPLTLKDMYVSLMSQSPISHSQQMVALSIARQYDPHYRALECATMDWYLNCFILRPLRNEAGRYCLNKCEMHSQRTVFFVFYINGGNVPIVYPNCYSNKDVRQPKHNMSCPQYYKSNRHTLAKAIPIEDARRLFEPFYKYLDSLAPRPAARDEHEDVVDMIVGTRPGRRLITQKELRGIERSARHAGGEVYETSLPLGSSDHAQKSLSGLVRSDRLLDDRVATPVNAMPRSLLFDERYSTASSRGDAPFDRVHLAAVDDECDLESFLRSSQHTEFE